jgi:Fe-S oxidoreductase
VNIVNERLLGIDRRRTLPRFARRSFQDWFRTHTPHRNAGDRGRVALLDDCLTSYCEPHVNRAAVKLLERAGYAIELTNLWCCGRPLLSKGFVDAAKQLARRNLARLDEFASTGTPLLGVEPSCLLTFVDEYPDLFPSDAAERVKQHSFLADAWIADRASAGELPALQPLEGIAVLHGHCQQNALVGTAGTRKLLSRIPNLTVKELDSGCCGMAGSFGYEHYDISQQIGERVLFPAVRQHSGPLLAPGFSCRHQIADATRRTAEHPLELVLKRLPE